MSRKRFIPVDEEAVIVETMSYLDFTEGYDEVHVYESGEDHDERDCWCEPTLIHVCPVEKHMIYVHRVKQ